MICIHALFFPLFFLFSFCNTLHSIILSHIKVVLLYLYTYNLCLCARTNNECAIDFVVVVGWYGVRALEPNNVEQIQKVQVRIENAK